MALEKWELSYQPCDKDKNRWQLRLKVAENELMSVINNLEGTKGRPFVVNDNDFNYGIYIYELNEPDVARVKKFLDGLSPAGAVQGPSREEALDAMLDKLAQGVDSAAKTAAPASKPEPPPRQEPAAQVPDQSGGVAAPAKTEFQELELNKGYTFDEFVIGPNNRFTSAAAQAVADNPGKIYNPFFIYGGVGLGKTHLMHAVGHYVKKKNPATKVLYVTTEKFMSEVIDAIRRGNLQIMRDHYRLVDLLLVDDIQFLVESESTQEEFFHTFNVLHQSGRQIIITSDRPPKHLTTLEDRLRSRFEWGLIADIKSPNLETRVAILKKKGETEHLKLDDNILLYIGSKLKSNIRELEGFLKRINAYASLTHQEVNMDLVRSLMADLLPAEELEDAPSPAPASKPPQAKAAPPVINTEPAPVKVEPPPVQDAPQPKPVIKQTPPPPPQEEIKEPETPKAPAAPKPKPAPPAPKPAQQESESGGKNVQAAFFYPEGKEAELAKVKERFTEVIRKHKLKFMLEGVFERPYAYTGRVNYAFFSELCKTNGVGIAIVLGPPPESSLDPEDFSNLLATVMDDERISLQFIPWAELNKDYRYLNLALDITLLKHKA
jgi:chromosomal replication initiator protein DnaA